MHKCLKQSIEDMENYLAFFRMRYYDKQGIPDQEYREFVHLMDNLNTFMYAERFFPRGAKPAKLEDIS